MNPIVLTQRHGDIVVIVVDNPPVNTITAAARAGLHETLDVVAADTAVRAVILRCAGNNFFTGADINEFSGPPKEAEYRELWARFEGLKVPMIAAMLALETRASSAVGVAISVTTIPASSYLGVAAGVGEIGKAAGALAVMGINIAMLVTGGTLALMTKDALARRAARKATPA